MKFSDAASARAFIETIKFPVVVKTDMGEKGKGVVFAENKNDAFCAIDFMFRDMHAFLVEIMEE